MRLEVKHMVEHTWTPTHTHTLLITQVTGSLQEHNNLPFSLPCADTKPPGYALKIHQLCVLVPSHLATAYLHQSLFWKCHSARVKRGARLIWRSVYAVPCFSMQSDQSVSLASIIVIYAPAFSSMCVCLAESLRYINE